MTKDCIIIFTRVPIPNKTKTRLLGFLSPDECVKLHTKLLKNIYYNAKATQKDILLFYTPKENLCNLKDILGDKSEYLVQEENLYKNLYDENKYLKSEKENKKEIVKYTEKSNENIDATQELKKACPNISNTDKNDDLGSKMAGAFKRAFDMGYKSVILLGSDIFEIKRDYFERAFEVLKNADMLISPTFDGGYALIGMNNFYPEVFDIEKYGDEDVFSKTLQKIKLLNIKCEVLQKLRDIDTKEDLIKAYLKNDNITLLGQGEYNINYLYEEDGIKKVFRINTHSQLNLKNQIKYEYDALKILEVSKVTPKVYWLDDEKKLIPYGVLSMQYLKGRVLDYNKDMEIAAYLLSKLHSVKIPSQNNLIFAKKPFKTMFEEFETMFSKYQNFAKKDVKIQEKIEFLLDKIKNLGLDDDIKNPVIVNTELNNTNFIIGNDKTKSYIIDFEKPIISDAEQDVAHFLAPTTTFWKTDIIFTKDMIDSFVLEYEKYRKLDKNLLYKYISFTCLRGITWCAMAYVEYMNNEKLIQNEFAFEKIKKYLQMPFLEKIEEFIL